MLGNCIENVRKNVPLVHNITKATTCTVLFGTSGKNASPDITAQ